MAEELKPDITDLHFGIFGQIISSYALREMLLKAALACSIGIDLRVIAGLTARMGAIDVQKKAKGSASDLAPPLERQALLQFADTLGSASEIRNKIAHATWGPGKAPGSLRSSETSISAKGIKVHGFDDGETEYGLAEFDACAETLSTLSTDILTFLKARNYPGAD